MFKNYKKILIISSIILLLFLSINTISASKNIKENPIESVEITNNNIADNTLKNTEIENKKINTINNNKSSLKNLNKENLKTSNKSASTSKTNPILRSTNDKSYNGIVKSTNVEYPTSQQYSKENMVYPVKLYEIVTYDGITYKEPKYNSVVKLRVKNGNKFKNYYGIINNTGIASFNIPNLSRGTHLVEIYYLKHKKRFHLTITQSKPTVYAPATTIKHNQSNYYPIKVVDSYGNSVKNLSIKLKVYTGNKYKTYNVKTNIKGIAKYQTKDLQLGTHKMIITSNNKNYKISKKTNIIIKNVVPKTVEKLSAYAPYSIVKYKKSNYFKINVTNNYHNPVKNLSIKLKVYTGNKYKTYNVKTNSKGIAKYQTKDLQLGTHKVIITSNNKNYKISKTSMIIVRNITPSNIEPPKLKTITYTPNSNNYSSVKLTWISNKGSSYQVIRKLNGNYKVVSTVKAESNKAVFYDNVTNGALYTYSVRELLTVNNENIIGPYDNEGLKLINSPNVSVDFQNLKAVINWQHIDGANKYLIFRKLNSNSNYKCIATVNANELSYTDYYYKSASELSSILTRNVFVDSSFNSLHYTVCACIVKTVDSVKKISYSPYLNDGDFKLEAPTIISLKDNKLTWAEVPNAEGYLILKSNNHITWETIGYVKSKNINNNSLTINEIDNNSYYTVQAFATKNGARVYSEYDKSFSLKYYSENNSKYKILYIGDSITYGTPYNFNLTTPIFSMPYRVSQLTGCVYYNPSIPGSSYHDSKEEPDVCCICRDVIDRIYEGKLPSKWKSLNTAANSEGVTNTNISDYNIVILSAGTNDYQYNAQLGSLDSNDITTFNGALNHILNKIHDASIYRIEHGLDPIKVVFVDLFYSNCVYTKKQIDNRDTTPNKLGYLLGDYQNALNQQLIKYKNLTKGTLELYHFKTRDYNIVNSENCAYTTQDNLHPTKFSYGQYGNMIAQFFVDNIF